MPPSSVVKAAAQVGGFAVVPMVDGSSGFASNTPEDGRCSLLSQLYQVGSAYKEDGEYVLSSFKAEGASVSWWTQVINLLETKYGLPVSFQAVFNNAERRQSQGLRAHRRRLRRLGHAYGAHDAEQRRQRGTCPRPRQDVDGAGRGPGRPLPVAVVG